MMSIRTVLLVLVLGCKKPSPEVIDTSTIVTDTADDDANVKNPTSTHHGRFAVVPPSDNPGVTDNPYDATEDPTEPSYVPTKKPLLGGAKKFGVMQSGVDDKLSEAGTMFRLTYYHISLRPQNDPDEVTLLDCKVNLLTRASRAWRADAIMEGTARYRDENGEQKAINIADGAGTCWLPLDWESRWGLGVWNPSTGNSYQLRPFRSIAIDRRELTIGAWYYIKELDGVQMPYPVSTMTHNGCVRAVDVGAAILGKHIDFYVAYASAYQKLIGTDGTPMYHRYNVTVMSGATRCKLHIDRGY